MSTKPTRIVAFDIMTRRDFQDDKPVVTSLHQLDQGGSSNEVTSSTQDTERQNEIKQLQEEREATIASLKVVHEAKKRLEEAEKRMKEAEEAKKN